MTRREFLRGLEEALQMDVPQSVINNQLAYYDQYITEEMAKGRSESEVVEELGDPRLLARTIEDATEAAGSAAYTDADYSSRQSYRQTERSYEESGGETQQSSPFQGMRGTSFQTNSTLGCLLISIIVIVIISVIGSIIGALMPVLAPIIIVLVILWLLKGIMNK